MLTRTIPLDQRPWGDGNESHSLQVSGLDAGLFIMTASLPPLQRRHVGIMLLYHPKIDSYLCPSKLVNRCGGVEWIALRLNYFKKAYNNSSKSH